MSAASEDAAASRRETLASIFRNADASAQSFSLFDSETRVAQTGPADVAAAPLEPSKRPNPAPALPATSAPQRLSGPADDMPFTMDVSHAGGFVRKKPIDELKAFQRSIRKRVIREIKQLHKHALKKQNPLKGAM